MRIARRDLLKFAGGATAGFAFTPVPWSLLRDSAVWSENWPGIPQPPRGEIRTRYTTCTLCPAGCGVRARCVGDQPVSLAGIAGHPTGGGALCPAGLLGHHLAFHPQRASGTVDVTAIAAAVHNCRAGESVAFLDPRPGRTASLVYRRFLERLGNGIYCAPPNAEPYGHCGIDLENARAIVSFGEPVLDGWLSPGRVLPRRGQFQLIQVEPAHSRTASMADVWVPIRPGGEAEFAVALTNAIKDASPTDEQIARVARMLQENKPAIALGSGPAVANLNLALGSVGQPGGFLPRREIAPPATDFSTVPDHSVRVLFLEEASCAEPVPEALLQRKLVRQNPVVVALTPWLDGYARRADYVIPAPVYLESLDEVPTPIGSTVASFSLSPALVGVPPRVNAPADFILRLAGEDTTYLDVLKARVAVIHKERLGAVFTYADGKSTRLAEVASAADLWKAMLGGACWLDDPLPASAKGFSEVAAEPVMPVAEQPLMLLTAAAAPPRSSPLMSKLYQESDLRRGAGIAAVNPETGRRQGLEHGCRAIVGSAAGTYKVQVLFDPGTMPGVIEMNGSNAEGPAAASIRRA